MLKIQSHIMGVLLVYNYNNKMVYNKMRFKRNKTMGKTDKRGKKFYGFNLLGFKFFVL